MKESPFTRRKVLLAGVAAASTGLARTWANDAPTVRLGQISLSFYAVTGGVVQEVLERLGHRVQVSVGPHEEIFPLLAASEIDLMAATWLPEAHAAYWSRFGAHAKEVARLYVGARFFWGVPDYVPADEVTSIADLTKRTVAQRMTKLIQGIGPGAAITTLSQSAIRGYGLDAAGYELRSGTPAEWTAAYEAAVRERRWLVFPTWTPQYLNWEGRIRPLVDSRGILGGPNYGTLVAPEGRLRLLPAATVTALSRIDLGLDAVTEMDWTVNVQRLTPRDAARRWIQSNASRFEAWLSA